MSSLHLKIIAVVSMIIDHIGLFFFPQHVIFFIIGRLAFPLFCYFVATGAHYSKNTNRYLMRLFVFALVSQVPFLLANKLVDPTFSYLNVLFTLCIGLLTIQIWKKPIPVNLRIISISFFVLLAEFFHTDYGGLGVLSVLLFFIYYENSKKMFISQILIFCLINADTFLYHVSTYGQTNSLWYYLPFAIISLFLITNHNGKEGKKLQYTFYLFYPLHLLIIYLIKGIQ